MSSHTADLAVFCVFRANGKHHDSADEVEGAAAQIAVQEEEGEKSDPKQATVQSDGPQDEEAGNAHENVVGYMSSHIAHLWVVPQLSNRWLGLYSYNVMDQQNRGPQGHLDDCGYP